MNSKWLQTQNDDLTAFKDNTLYSFVILMKQTTRGDFEKPQFTVNLQFLSEMNRQI